MDHDAHAHLREGRMKASDRNPHRLEPIKMRWVRPTIWVLGITAYLTLISMATYYIGRALFAN